jgi:hypothetical protein
VATVRHQRLLLPLLTVALLGAGPPLPAAHAGPRVRPAAKPAATIRREVDPLDSAHHLVAPYRIKHRYADASCQRGSATTGTTYTCFAATSPEGEFDSCWVQANTRFVICVVKPWRHKVAQLHVTRGYDDRNGFTHVHQPWGLRLGRATRCLVILAPVNSAQGHSIRYGCNHKTVLAGPVQRQSVTWRIRAYRATHHHDHVVDYKPLGWQPVAVAWSGLPSQAD